jgi:hypothetical protein
MSFWQVDHRFFDVMDAIRSVLTRGAVFAATGVRLRSLPLGGPSVTVQQES